MNDFTVMPDDFAFVVCEREHRELYDKCLQRVQKLMDWQPFRATLWMTSKNPLLGEVSPVSMIAHGRGHRLEHFITAAEEHDLAIL